MIGNGEDFEDMEDFGKERETWLRQFLQLPNGIPDSDTFLGLFERLNPEALSECLYDWLANNLRHVYPRNQRYTTFKPTSSAILRNDGRPYKCWISTILNQYNNLIFLSIF